MPKKKLMIKFNFFLKSLLQSILMWEWIVLAATIFSPHELVSMKKNKEQVWGISPLFLTIIPVNYPQNAPKIAKEKPFILKFKRIDKRRYIPWGPN